MFPLPRFVLLSSSLLTFLSQMVICDTTATPSTLNVLNTNISDCTFSISAVPALDTSGYDILFDTTKSSGSTPDSLAETSKSDTSESMCTVCSTISWSGAGDGGAVWGLIERIEYDYWHRLEPGSLEQVVSHVFMENGTREEWFESSYIYGAPETNITYNVRTIQPNASEPLLLDYTREKEEICVRTWFRVVSRGAWGGGASAELSKKSVFKLGVKIGWVSEKP
ncbi:hypothetical protein CC78DRAFT_584443 [Lojkania enalia]|uniref:Uncharacterized protein n=1 Tax=Lojkania enalia TaxID=147567 RepID=A0A9P4K2A1_9PLEO|nr:hypothetical protein CC78DRAFT_584443 [Didymosphaeria enalia]